MKKNYGTTSGGRNLDDERIKKLAQKAEAGFDTESIIKRRGAGRPTIGSAAASVESVRLDPELQSLLRSKASSTGKTSSELIRTALRQYLEAS